LKLTPQVVDENRKIYFGIGVEIKTLWGRENINPFGVEKKTTLFLLIKPRFFIFNKKCGNKRECVRSYKNVHFLSENLNYFSLS